MKRVFLLTLSLLSSTTLWAQQSSITSRLSDSYSGEGIIGAVVELSSLEDANNSQYNTSAYNGAVKFSGVKYGKYIIKASFLGYEDYIDTLNINTARVVIPDMKMLESATQIDAVVKEVQALRTSQSGDTLSYNAAAFKVTADADVEGLLKKMPGITVTDGEVTAQGETVEKIYVDGREFFGSDVTTAISSLPAEMVESIDVFDKLSDNAELSGIDDGEGYKSINIVTKANMREGFFGKLYAGYGYQPEVEGEMSNHKYLAGGSVNYFKGAHRISVIGLFNNINQQNFSFDDVIGVSTDGSARGYMVRPQSGVAEVGALGTNYSGAFGEGDKLKIEASYFYNGTTTENFSTTERWYEDPSDVDTLFQEGYSLTPNYNHRINARVDWKITPTQQLTVRQSGSFQTNDPYSTTVGSMWGESGYSAIDSYSSGDKSGLSSNTSLSYIARVVKPGRMISMNASYNVRNTTSLVEAYSNAAAAYTNEDGSPVTESQIATIYSLYYGQVVDLLYSSVNSPSNSQTLSAELGYTEPLATGLSMTLKYKYNNNMQDTEKSTYYTTDNYDTTGLTPSAAASNSRESQYVTQSAGPGLYYIMGKSKFSANVEYQYSELSGNALVNGDNDNPIDREYFDWTYSGMANVYFNDLNSIRMMFSAKTSNPPVSYLVDAYDLSNTQYISKGNPELDPSFTQSVRLRFVSSSIERGSTFMVMGMVDHTDSYIGNHVIYSPSSFDIDGVTYSPIQYSTNVNLDNYWSARGTMSYGFPVNFIKSNLNLELGANYSLTPSMYGGTILSDGTIDGGTENLTDNMGVSSGVVIGSNISEYLDFTLAWNGAYNEATNSASSSSEKNKYVSQTASATIKWIFGPGITFNASTTYNEYMGITNDYQDSYLLCNVYLGKQIFRNKRGELKVGVNDLLNQNTSFARTIASGYTQNTYNSVIGRYYTIQLVYNLRSFGNSNQRGEGGEGEGRMGMGMGRPPGSGGGPGMPL